MLLTLVKLRDWLIKYLLFSRTKLVDQSSNLKVIPNSSLGDVPPNVNFILEISETFNFIAKKKKKKDNVVGIQNKERGNPMGVHKVDLHNFKYCELSQQMEIWYVNF